MNRDDGQYQFANILMCFWSVLDEKQIDDQYHCFKTQDNQTYDS